MTQKLLRSEHKPSTSRNRKVPMSFCSACPILIAFGTRGRVESHYQFQGTDLRPSAAK